MCRTIQTQLELLGINPSFDEDEDFRPHTLPSTFGTVTLHHRIHNSHAHAKAVTNRYYKTYDAIDRTPPNPGVDLLLEFVIPNCMDCDKLIDAFGSLQYKMSLLINLSNVGLELS